MPSSQTQRPAHELTVKLRVRCGAAFAFGPGKADLLEAIDACRSIAGAGEKLGLSYWKTRRLVDEMNACFKAPVIESVRGGSQKGGTLLTDTGRRAVALFRRMEAAAEAAARETFDELEELLKA